MPRMKRARGDNSLRTLNHCNFGAGRFGLALWICVDEDAEVEVEAGVAASEAGGSSIKAIEGDDVDSMAAPEKWIQHTRGTI